MDPLKEELRRRILPFLGRRVRVWTPYTQPVEGMLVYVSLVPPFLLILVDDRGRPHIFNMHRVVEIEAKETFKVP